MVVGILLRAKNNGDSGNVKRDRSAGGRGEIGSDFLQGLKRRDKKPELIFSKDICGLERINLKSVKALHFE